MWLYSLGAVQHGSDFTRPRRLSRMSARRFGPPTSTLKGRSVSFYRRDASRGGCCQLTQPCLKQRCHTGVKLIRSGRPSACGAVFWVCASAARLLRVFLQLSFRWWGKFRTAKQLRPKVCIATHFCCSHPFQNNRVWFHFDRPQPSCVLDTSLSGSILPPSSIA